MPRSGLHMLSVVGHLPRRGGSGALRRAAGVGQGSGEETAGDQARRCGFFGLWGFDGGRLAVARCVACWIARIWPATVAAEWICDDVAVPPEGAAGRAGRRPLHHRHPEPPGAVSANLSRDRRRRRVNVFFGSEPTWARLVETQPSRLERHALITTLEFLHMTRKRHWRCRVLPPGSVSINSDPHTPNGGRISCAHRFKLHRD